MPSTVIRRIDYDSATLTLTVSFVTGQTYAYKGVPETVYKELAASRVRGRYLRFFVKDKYPFERMTDKTTES